VVFSGLRFSLNLGILERPLVFGAILGLVLGDVQSGIAVGLFFELFWLDLIPAGTYIPPNALLSVCITLGLIRHYQLEGAGECLPALILGIPGAYIGAWLERMHRSWQDRGYNRLLAWAKGSSRGSSPQAIVRYSLVQLASVNLLLVLICMLAALSIFGLAVHLAGPALFLPLSHFSWPMLWLTAAVGGVLALRVKDAYRGFALGVSLVFLVLLLQ
jgi:PTS system mannose-specific IIC component